MIIKRGNIYLADLGEPVGSEQGGERPVLVVQNNTGNRYSPTVIVVPVTTSQTKRQLPTHVKVCGLARPSIALCEQIRTIDKQRIYRKVGSVTQQTMELIRKGLAFSIEI